MNHTHEAMEAFTAMAAGCSEFGDVRAVAQTMEIRHPAFTFRAHPSGEGRVLLRVSRVDIPRERVLELRR